jgi:hypothetical protein
MFRLETFSLAGASNRIMNISTYQRIVLHGLVSAMAFAWLASPAMAQGYYYPMYQPAYGLPANGAALGPWPWNFNFGGGPTTVVGGATNKLINGYNFTVGTGYNFTPRVGLDLEFMDDGFGVTNAQLVQNQAIDGDAHIWSVTLDPVYRWRLGGPFGAYIIGGGGYYEEDSHYTEQAEVFFPTFHGGFFAPGYEDVYQTNGAGGVNGGLGLTWNLGWGTKLYVEARYHYIFTSGGNTQLIPVTIGFRW